jgi:Flp pilus assembly protein TadG
MTKTTISGGFGERGAVAVEFALVATVLFAVLMGIIAVGHWMYTLEMVSDATRTAARMAAVCDLDDAQIKQAVQNRVPQLFLTTGQIAVTYLPDGCSPQVAPICQSIQVSLTGVTYTTLSPFIGSAMGIPAFTTQVPRETMESTHTETVGGTPTTYTNPVCGTV